MTREDLIKITGQHLLFLGANTGKWGPGQFGQAAQFAHAHGVDCLLVKVHDGTNRWYGNMGSWQLIKQAIQEQGVGVIPYGYSYANKFGALDTEIDLMLEYMQDSGVYCMDAELEWNGDVASAQYLCNKIVPADKTFLVSTWADPSLQNWESVIRALSPCVDVWMPQQYNNYLATFWQEFGNNGAVWLQPTVNLTQDFGANDPVAIAQAAHSQGHTALSVWYYDTAVTNPGLLDQVYAAFPKGGQSMRTYSPNSYDYNAYFTANSDGNWTCKSTNAVIIGSNLSLYSQLSIDGNTLPLIGLPLQSEQYHTESDGYKWSSQQFERATMVYDPAHRFDDQPGMETSYLAHVNPPQTTTALPVDLKEKIETNTTLAAAMQQIANQFAR